MTKVDSDAWVAKAKKRKAYRDQTREAFFSAVGVKKGEVQQTHQGAPEKQRLLVTQLLKATKKGGDIDSTQATMITEMAKLLGATGLGKGEMGGLAKTDFDLNAMSMKNLRDNWFWSPAFFD